MYNETNTFMGYPTDRPNRILMAVRLPPSLDTALRARAKAERRPLTGIVEELLVLGLQQPPTPQPTFYTGEK